MGLPRSTYLRRTTKAKPSDAELVAEIRAITDVFECYGYRRVGAELRHRGHVVNAKKVRRLMREHDLNPRRRRRFTRTTDSDHDGPIYPVRRARLRGPRPRPALGGGPDLCRHRDRLRLRRGHSRRLVAPRRRLRDRPQPRRPARRRRARAGGGAAAAAARLRRSTPTAGRNTPRRSIARSSPPTASSAR